VRGIVWEAVRRLLFHDVHVETSFGFWLMFISITMILSAPRALPCGAQVPNSQELEADALTFHRRLHSTVVILGHGLVYVSNKNQISLNVKPLTRQRAWWWPGIWLSSPWAGGKRTNALVDAAPTGTSGLIGEAGCAGRCVLSLDRIDAESAAGCFR